MPQISGRMPNSLELAFQTLRVRKPGPCAIIAGTACRAISQTMATTSRMIPAAHAMARMEKPR